MTRLSGILFAVVLTTTAVADASAPADPARHAFDRARWSVAREDTVAALDLLRTIDPAAAPHTRAVLVRLQFDDVIADARDDDRTATWNRLLRWIHGEGDLRPSDDATEEEIVLLAAAALDAGHRDRARAWLEDVDPSDRLRATVLHLRALAADDEREASRHREALARLDVKSAVDRRLVDAAALRRGAEALAAGEDPSPWFGRLDGDARAWADWLLALRAPDDTRSAALDAWIAAHPEHPGVVEARLRRAGIALAAGDDPTARALHLDLEDDLAREAEDLESVAADSLRRAAWTEDLWREADHDLSVDPSTWAASTAGLRAALIRDDDLPTTERIGLAIASDPSPSRLDPDDRAEDARLGADVDAARREVDRARRGLDAVRAMLDARDAYRARGSDHLTALDTELDAARARIDSLASRAPAVLTALRAVEDSLLHRLDTRRDALRARAQAQAERARDLARWYGRGPMARRDPAPHPEVPVPAAHLDAENAWARETTDALDVFGTRTTEVVRRSFSEVFARRLGEGSQRALLHADSLRTAAATAIDSMAADRLRTAQDPRLLAAITVHDDAIAHWNTTVATRDAHRRTVAARVLAAERADLDARREAVAYGTAVATTRLALDADPTLRDEARDRWAAFIDADCDPRVRGDARYRWADLELVVAQDRFRESMGAWLENGSGGERALAPLLDIEPALALFRAILDEDPAFDRSDLVLLHLGMLHADRGDPEAVAYLERLVTDHPQSPVVSEAQLRRGEIAFEARDFEAALAPLRAASTADDPEIRAVALYELGWSAHATGRMLEAIDAFDTLLALYASDDAPQSFDLADEARGLYLRSIARAGGAPAFAATLERNGERADAPDLLADLSSLLTGYALHDQAAAADRMFLDRYGDDPGALDAAQRWIDAAGRQGGTAAADDALLAVVDRFVPEGSWTTAQAGDSLRTAGTTFARDGLVGVAVRRHRTVRETPDPTAWRATRDLYARLATTWPADADVAQWHLLAGECARAVDDHATALEHFARAANDSGDVGEQAAWQMVATRDAWYRASIPEGATAGVDSLARRFVEDADAYRARRPDDEGNADLAWRSLQIVLAHAWDDEVSTRGEDFVAAYPDDPRRVDAVRLRAEAFYRRDAFLDASRAFEIATRDARTAGRDSLATELEPWIPHSFELHVAQVATDSTAATGALWRELADRWPDYEKAEDALYRSGLAFADAGSDSLAIDAWRTLVDRHPDGTYGTDARRNLARSLEDSGDIEGAATALVAFADAYPDAQDAADALLHAIDLHERAGDTAARDALLDTYLQRHPNDLQTLQAVRETRARTEIEAGVDGPALAAYLEFAAAHPDLASPALLAQRDFRAAEANWDAYAALTLTQPLEPSLVRKRDALTALLEDFRTVAERGVSPWAEAATVRIGEALLLMGDALVQSERPAGLEGDDLLAYDEVIANQAWTFHDRGESALRELLRVQRSKAPSDDDPSRTWTVHARELLFPRMAERFLHQPSFDYPVMEGSTVTRNDAAADDTSSTTGSDEASDLHTRSE